MASNEQQIRKISITYPRMLPDRLGQTREQFEQEAKLAMAVKLFEARRISSGVAAELAGLDRVTFLLSLHRFGTPMIDLEEDEIQTDYKNA